MRSVCALAQSSDIMILLMSFLVFVDDLCTNSITLKRFIGCFFFWSYKMKINLHASL